VVHQFQVGGAPKVTHFIAADPGAPREQ